MKLKTQILSSILGITIFAQIIFGFLAYRQIADSRGDQLTIFLKGLSQELANKLQTPDNILSTKAQLEELQIKFSTPMSLLIIQKNKKTLYKAGTFDLDTNLLDLQLYKLYSDSNQHGIVDINGSQFYWAISDLPNNNFQLIMLESVINESHQISSTLRVRLFSSGLIIIWLAVWISLLLTSKITRVLDIKKNQLEYMALHDNLTGLPNRKLLADRMDKLLFQAAKQQDPFAFFLMDLDRFKEVNDTLGHHFGDELLKMVSLRLQGSIRDEDTIVRLGGDEFAVLLPKTDLAGAILCAERILEAMEAKFLINKVSTESKTSIGIALYPEHGDSEKELMQHADVAMYQAKKTQSGYAIYNPTQNTYTLRRLQIMSDLHQAIENHEIQADYQPIVLYDESKVIGVEALARWQHPELGQISPDEFIPMAEQMGLIRTLTLQIFSTAIKHCKKWHENGHEISISINLSVYCLQDLSLPDEISNIIQSNNFEAKYIELEITEGALMLDLYRAEKILKKLNKMEIRIAIDDFGTGFSSLSYLKNLPVNTIKIDKSFILEMCSNSTDRAVVKTIVELGHNLGCKVVAEGVENQRTLHELNVLNIDKMQGFYFSKALPDIKLLAWLKQYKQSNKSLLNIE